MHHFNPRKISLLLHRWAGLAMALFLVVVGLTGSALAFYSEIDRAINPVLYPKLYPAVQSGAVRLNMAELAERTKILVPDVEIKAVYLREPERAEIRISVPKNMSQKNFDTVLLDPYSGAELARYTWGDIAQGRVNIMPFIYRLHYELALGSFGMWTLGIIALIWTLDCFVGFYLTLPAHRKTSSGKSWWRRWKPSWRIKRSANASRFNFDWHRASGLWLWPILLMFAWSSVYMNLYDTLYTWTTKALFEYKTTWTEIKPLKSAPTMQRLSWHDALHASQTLLEKETLQQETKKQQVTVIAPVSLRYDDEKGIFRYQVRTDRDIQNRRGVTELVIDAYTGELRLFLLPTGQYTGNTISNWLYALHMANVFGMAWKILVCLLGILIAGLSVTGVLIWWRKRIRSR